ncbi:hypothetical protein [Micromonospora sp. Llam0]|uniref:hypothetical protein n=1 Tax=Micromonospora sp. Llam0 TaxID=2485143 RepID=UPI000F47FF0E|nr:hypothetical protein [Micromonospora sp. Llam0]
MGASTRWCRTPGRCGREWVKHVDADLLERIRSTGGLVYRTHAIKYGYVRRTTAHTFHAQIDDLAKQAERVYDGLPAEIITPPVGASDRSPVTASTSEDRA